MTSEIPLPKSLWASSLPALMATGVSSMPPYKNEHQKQLQKSVIRMVVMIVRKFLYHIQEGIYL